MASLFETEQLVESGDTDTINLSPEYIVRKKYQAQFNHFCDTDGKEQITRGRDGDVSEPTFSARKGMAFCPAGTVVNEQTRLDGFLSKETTDDHMMHIVGMAHNQFGERFFIAKNSSGAIGAHKGYVYLSENYVRLKTISILIDKECVVFL